MNKINTDLYAWHWYIYCCFCAFFTLLNVWYKLFQPYYTEITFAIEDCYFDIRNMISLAAVSFSVNCGPGWEERPLSQYCYSFHQDQLSWLDAREVCKNMGGDLASVHSDDEETYIKGNHRNFLTFIQRSY